MMIKETKLNTVPHLKIRASEGFTQWLTAHKAALAFTSRPANKLFLAGVDQEEKLNFSERSFDHIASIAVAGDSLFISTLFQVWHLNNTLLPDQSHKGYDRIYLPRTAHTTGSCDIHDMALDAKGRLIFVNTRFSCIAALSASHSFKPLWKPDFITALLPEDRCHLSGMALSKDRQVKYITAFAVSDSKKGWQGQDINSGILMEVATQKKICTGLCMPHSPRIHDNKIWLLNSGAGQLGYVDSEKSVFTPILSCPGFLRGLVFLDHYAIVTVSAPGGANVSSDSPLGKNMKNHQSALECGILIVDLNTQKIAHKMQFEGAVEALTEIAVLPGCQSPMVMGLSPGEIKDVFSIEPVQISKKPDETTNPILV